MKVIESKNYENRQYGISAFSGERVEIIGEQLVENENGKMLDQYLYNIIGYEPKNGLPFASLKANILLDK